MKFRLIPATFKISGIFKFPTNIYSILSLSLILMLSAFSASSLLFSTAFARSSDGIVGIIDDQCILDSEVQKLAIGIIVMDDLGNGIPFDPLSIDGLEPNANLYNAALKALATGKILQIEARNVGIQISDMEVMAILEKMIQDSKDPGSFNEYVKTFMLFNIRNSLIQDRIKNMAVSGFDVYTDRQIAEINDMRRAIKEYDKLFTEVAKKMKVGSRKKKISITELTVSKIVGDAEIDAIDQMIGQKKNIHDIERQYSSKNGGDKVRVANKGWREYDSLDHQYKEALENASIGYITKKIDFGDSYKYILVNDLMLESEVANTAKINNMQAIDAIVNAEKMDIVSQVLYGFFDRHYIKLKEKKEI